MGLVQRRADAAQRGVRGRLNGRIGGVPGRGPIGVGGGQGVVDLDAIPTLAAEVGQDVAKPLLLVGRVAVVGRPDLRKAPESERLARASRAEQPVWVVAPDPAVPHTGRQITAVLDAGPAAAAVTAGGGAVIRSHTGQVLVDPHLYLRVGFFQYRDEPEIPRIQDHDRVVPGDVLPLRSGRGPDLCLVEPAAEGPDRRDRGGAQAGRVARATRAAQAAGYRRRDGQHGQHHEGGHPAAPAQQDSISWTRVLPAAVPGLREKWLRGGQY